MIRAPLGATHHCLVLDQSIYKYCAVQFATLFRSGNIPLLRSLEILWRYFYKHTAPSGAMIMSAHLEEIT
jgi:hypothetical protein